VEKTTKKPGLIGRALGILLVLLFPFPLALISALGIPPQVGWPYAVGYAAWIAFALLLDRIATHGWPVKLRFAGSRAVRWPHLRIGFCCLGLLLVVFLMARIRMISDPILTWSIWNVLIIVAFMEGAIVASNRTKISHGST
jgi:hypothetical protein